MGATGFAGEEGNKRVKGGGRKSCIGWWVVPLQTWQIRTAPREASWPLPCEQHTGVVLTRMLAHHLYIHHHHHHHHDPKERLQALSRLVHNKLICTTYLGHGHHMPDTQDMRCHKACDAGARKKLAIQASINAHPTTAPHIGSSAYACTSLGHQAGFCCLGA
eukprot:1146622-Pelagomonas_calceolata.AAC.5